MTQTQTKEIEPITSRVDPYRRGDVLIKVEVDCYTAIHPAPGGHLLNFGKQIIKIRKADLPSLLEQVEEHPEEIVASRQRFEVKLKRYIADGLEGIEGALEREKRTEQLIGTYPGSPEAVFFDDTGRDIKPLRSVVVIEDNIAAPIDEVQNEQSTVVAAAVAREVAKVFRDLGLVPSKQAPKDPPPKG